jgi:hypothetical protein
MTDIHATAESHNSAATAANDRPTRPSDGGKLRQTPWETIGMSRASWYRHGKPSTKPKRGTQRETAQFFGVSIRTIQRHDVAFHKAIREEERRLGRDLTDEEWNERHDRNWKAMTARWLRGYLHLHCLVESQLGDTCRNIETAGRP